MENLTPETNNKKENNKPDLDANEKTEPNLTDIENDEEINEKITISENQEPNAQLRSVEKAEPIRKEIENGKQTNRKTSTSQKQPDTKSVNDKELENGVKKVDLDSILVEELGQFGMYQLRMMLLALVVAVFGAWAAVEYVFTTARIEHRCLIPECESPPAAFSPAWLPTALPTTSAASATLDSCFRFANATLMSPPNPTNGTCPAELFNQQQVVPCEQYVYENMETVVYDFNLACNEWQRSLIGSVRTAGVLVAMPLTGLISDRWGRRVALVFNAFNTAWLGALRYFADTYAGFLVSEFAEAFMGAGGFTCTYILVMELMGPKYRVAGGVMMNTFFALGQATTGLLAWAVPRWRPLTLTLYLPQLITITFYWLVSESVRWYLSKGRIEDAELVLREVARVNKKQLSEKSLQGLRKHAGEERAKREREVEVEKGEPWLVVQVFRNKPILVRCCVSPVWWITTTFIYYGLSINSINLTGNKYLNYVTVSLVEIPGFWLAFLLLGVVGRKAVLIGAFWMCAACQIAFIFIPSASTGASIAVYMVGKMCIASVVCALYVYTAELYPTPVRNSLFAFSSMMGRIGSILAPLTPALGAEVWEPLPFVLFGSFALLSGLLMFTTPETLGCKLPDTMEEACALGRSRKKPQNA